MGTREPGILVSNLEKRYRMGRTWVTALRRVSLTVPAGEFFVITGTSGSGKTTLLNCLGGLERPSGGSVRVDGTDVHALGDQALSRWRCAQVGFVFQTFNLLPTLSAWENVEYPLMLLGVGRRERRERAREALARVGLDGVRDHRPADLSGGQRQRVALARAVVKTPRLVLADEPSANLDDLSTRQILGLMQELVAERGLTFVVTTHDPLVMQAAGSRVDLAHGELQATAGRSAKEAA